MRSAVCATMVKPCAKRRGVRDVRVSVSERLDRLVGRSPKPVKWKSAANCISNRTDHLLHLGCHRFRPRHYYSVQLHRIPKVIRFVVKLIKPSAPWRRLRSQIGTVTCCQYPQFFEIVPNIVMLQLLFLYALVGEKSLQYTFQRLSSQERPRQIRLSIFQEGLHPNVQPFRHRKVRDRIRDSSNLRITCLHARFPSPNS